MPGFGHNLHRLAALAPLGLLLALSVACNPTPGKGEFDAEELTLNKCGGKDVMPWEPGFFTIDTFEDKVTIRLQSIGGGIDALDGIFIQVDRDVILQTIQNPEADDVPGDVKGEVPLGSPDQRQAMFMEGFDVPEPFEGEPDEGVARAVIGFYKTCPQSTDVPEPIGTIRFTRFEPSSDGQITGFVEAPVVVDGRSGAILGRNLTGNFSFVVQKGRPYTNFTGPGNFDP